MASNAGNVIESRGLARTFHVVDGARAAMLGRIAGPAVALGLGAAFGLAVVGLVVGTRTFQNESA